MTNSLPILSKMLAEMFGETVRTSVAANPRAHRKSTFTEPGNNSRRYHEYTNGKGQRVRFYRAVHRNIAGYFVIWRETLMKNGTIKNDMLRSFKKKAAARSANDLRYKKARAALAKAKGEA